MKNVVVTVLAALIMSIPLLVCLILASILFFALSLSILISQGPRVLWRTYRDSWKDRWRDRREIIG